MTSAKLRIVLFRHESLLESRKGERTEQIENLFPVLIVSGSRAEEMGEGYEVLEEQGSEQSEALSELEKEFQALEQTAAEQRQKMKELGMSDEEIDEVTK